MLKLCSKIITAQGLRRYWSRYVALNSLLLTLERINLLNASSTITCCFSLEVLVERLVLLSSHSLLVFDGCLLFKIRLIKHLLLLPMLLHHGHILHLGELFGCSLLWDKILVRHFHLVKCDRAYFLRSRVYLRRRTAACQCLTVLQLLWDVMVCCDNLACDSLVVETFNHFLHRFYWSEFDYYLRLLKLHVAIFNLVWLHYFRDWVD